MVDSCDIMKRYTLTSSLHLVFENNRHNAIYVISDIHSNLPALQAVLNEIPQSSWIICCGDIVSYYINPDEVCSLLRERNVNCIKGNHDKYLLGELPYTSDKEETYRIEFNKSRLSAENYEWLKSLPDQISIDRIPFIEDGRALVVHGSPISQEQYIYPDTPIEYDLSCFPSFIISGHTHHPMLRQSNQTILLNPGSVGQPRDWHPGANYATINLYTGDVKFSRASYDIRQYQFELIRQCTHYDMVNILTREK